MVLVLGSQPGRVEPDWGAAEGASGRTSLSLCVHFFQRPWGRFLQESVPEQREVLVSIQLPLFKVLPVPLPLPLPLPQPLPLLLQVQVCARWPSLKRVPAAPSRAS